ncbi:hypothetical protein E2C01_015788 [Portunus trituberculatus]|uniref:Uncharacterized protein n=1 Tax=Portunus trituberculatus TaxID=210409 RepID=A0A5B7DP00_PORTR|nr:hypothetical protein [Portunus trituberculatus]
MLTASTCQKGQERQWKKAHHNTKWVIRMRGAASGFLSHLHMGKRSDVASRVECQCGKYKKKTCSEAPQPRPDPPQNKRLLPCHPVTPAPPRRILLAITQHPRHQHA